MPISAFMIIIDFIRNLFCRKMNKRIYWTLLIETVGVERGSILWN